MSDRARRPGAQVVWVLAAVHLAGCGASARGDSEASSSWRAPLTDNDPTPHRPFPSSTESANGVRAMAVSSHEDSAIQLALEFVAAVRDGDAVRIRALVTPNMYRLGERDTYRAVPAMAAIRTLNPTGTRVSASGARPAPVARLLLVQRVEVSAPRPSSPDVAGDLLPGDTLVTFPVTSEGRTELARWYAGWSTRVRILVRTSGPPRVIGF